MAGEEAVQYHFYGTPLEDEVESTGHHKDVKDAASSRALPVWKQVTRQLQAPLRHGEPFLLLNVGLHTCSGPTACTAGGDR